MKLSQRSHKKELLDGENIPAEDLHQNLKELEFINTFLGGHRITLAGYRYFVSRNKQDLHFVEIGCGGGDNMKILARMSRRLKRNDRFTGIDLKADCIAYARENCATYPEIDFIVSDYREAEIKSDVIFSSLFCHHLKDNELKECFLWQQEHARLGFFLNDLHRHVLAYYSIKYLTQLFSKSYLVKNDAPLSVSRGFVKEELESVIKQPFVIKWMWAFRYLLIKENVLSQNI